MSSPTLELELPDGTRLTVPEASTPLDAARQIGPGLAKAALAGRLDDAWVDLRAPLRSGGKLRLITARDDEAGDVIRHSAEHVMADAVKRLWPGTQIDVGRSGRDGKFQYDFDIPVRLGRDDLPRIEAEMQRIIGEDLPFERQVVSHAEALSEFEKQGEVLKVSRIGDLAADAEITLFRHGSFVDVCRGPHVQSTRQIGAFKLIDISGSYWRGDESNPMLQRIYGVAFGGKKQLKAYEARIEEALKRDHRRLGAELGLFMFHEWSPGSPFFLPNGQKLYNALVGYMRDRHEEQGFQEVTAPQVFSADLFKVSGHYENFHQDMFMIPEPDGGEIALKPMNCPGHCLIFRSTKRSYRELPLRFNEYSRLHRYERSGTLHGLTRVRSFVQDDAHIFCEPGQVPDELDAFMAMMTETYKALGLDGIQVAVATRPDQFIGEPGDWDRAEQELYEAVERAGYPCGTNPGEGAFYAPKIECNFKDVLDRVWTLGTAQIDMGAPGRFGLEYVGRDGADHQPAMLHRAVLGSLERFIAIYLEHTGGDLPLWLSPVQAVILPISERHEAVAARTCQALREAGLRVEADDRSETLNYRVRSAEMLKVPFIVVVGDAEAENGSVTVRRRHSREQRTLALKEFVETMQEEVRTRGVS
ncbi:MAG: threonine--tRNA ligase [Deltaproteobacteria bacterium]|nr:threonine--tRNA ligase [Deltaproteobacteria bacterium]MBW2413549.1 threonine--tRNA ligase [Deltaproteobacteria bacterium]